MARPGGVLLPSGVGFPPFHVVGVGEKEREIEEKEGGGAAPPPSPIRTRLWGEGGAACPRQPLSLSRMAQ